MIAPLTPVYLAELRADAENADGFWKERVLTLLDFIESQTEKVRDAA